MSVVVPLQGTKRIARSASLRSRKKPSHPTVPSRPLTSSRCFSCLTKFIASPMNPWTAIAVSGVSWKTRFAVRVSMLYPDDCRVSPAITANFGDEMARMEPPLSCAVSRALCQRGS